MSDKTTIQFISRAYPPILGGIENQNKAVHDHLCKHKIVRSIINKYGKKALPIFLPWAILKSLFDTSKTTLLGDGVLAIIPWIVKKLNSKKYYICIVHGLDITFPSRLYQKLWVKTFFSSIDHFIAVSQHTKDILIDKGINRKDITVVHNGFDFSDVTYKPDRNKIDLLLGEKTKNKILLLTLGRIVKRKGVKWFITNVLPELNPAIIYIIAGSGGGTEAEEIKIIIKEKKLSDQVKYLGQVTNSEKEILLSNCDCFIQPNIKVMNDVEGFGISVIEASAYSLPVIAANLEGLRDAIHDNQNGWLVESGNKVEFINIIKYTLEKPEQLKEFGLKFKNYSQSQFDWKQIIQKYIRVIDNLD